MNAGRGTFIEFATAPGRTASDNPNGQNGLFTQYLLDALAVPGLGLNDVFDLVREKVDAASGGKQLPWTLSSVVGRYSFVPGVSGEAPVPGSAVTGAPNTVPPSVVVDRGPQSGQVKLNEKDGQRYVWIPRGKFTMGCSPDDHDCAEEEKPAHEVEITRGFWLGQTAVTVGAWKRYRAATGKPALPTKDLRTKSPMNEAIGNDSMPATDMNWLDAKGFCEWSGGRLPTEAEWEYAARAGSAASRYGSLDAIAWYGDNSGKERIDSTEIVRREQTTRKKIGAEITLTDNSYLKRLVENGNGPHPAGLKQPNAWNLYDMVGNAWQWTADCTRATRREVRRTRTARPADFTSSK
jgi:formylglycine-generating enzyme required for sulfatase activity